MAAYGITRGKAKGRSVSRPVGVPAPEGLEGDAEGGGCLCVRRVGFSFLSSAHDCGLILPIEQGKLGQFYQEERRE